MWDIDAREVINKLEKCEACALGNMMLSHVRVFDKISLEEIDGERDSITDTLGNYFEKNQLDLIEVAFEGEMCGWYIYPTEEFDKAVENFTQKYSDVKKRLRAIMINIVRNDGTFKP